MTFNEAAKDAGFSLKQIEFLEEWVAPNGHQHTVDDILGLDQAVEEIVEASEEEEDEEG